MLNRMGVKAQILIITEVETDVAGNCTLDDAGRWHVTNQLEEKVGAAFFL